MKLRDAILLGVVACTATACAEDEERPSVIACGVLGGADAETGRVWGWAQVVDAPPVPVRIEVDGEIVATVRADAFRDDLVDKELHPTGEAGFSTWVEGLADSTEVRAFIDLEAIELELTRSPLDVSISSAPAPDRGDGDDDRRRPLGWCSADSWSE